MKHLYTLLTIILLTATTAWSQDSIKYSYDVQHLGQNINTPSAEAGGLIYNDSIFIYSTMEQPRKQRNRIFNFDDETMHVYEAPISKNGHIGWGKISKMGFNHSYNHSGNVAIDPSGDAFYFTRCKEEEGKIICHIYSCKKVKGKWQKAKELKGDINLEGYTSTQPTIGYTTEGSTILYFSSDRPGGMGGDDIWYVLLNEGEPEGECINLGIPVNSRHNEITPYYDNQTDRLYFSSDRAGGKGGMDIYYSQGSRNSWRRPHNMQTPINSKYNDIYFYINPQDPDMGFLTSNRADSYYLQEESCCNDIYRWKRELNNPLKDQKPIPVVAKLPEVDLKPATNSSTGISYQANSMMPIKLYFHNDEPDPKSESAITDETYFQTYNKYMFMRHQYLKSTEKIKDSVAREEAIANVNDFFDNEVHANCDKFEQFLKLLTEDIKMGSHVSLTITGHASTPHSKGYNFKLSKRRISSIINQIMNYENGILQLYIGSNRHGSLQIKEVPYGNEQAISKRNEGLYSIAAAEERRIEIIDYNYLDSDPYAISMLTMPKGTHKIGELPSGKISNIAVELHHTSKEPTDIEFISVTAPHVHITGNSRLIPGKDLIIYLSVDNSHVERTDSILIPLTIKVKGEDITQTIFLEYKITLSDK